MSTIKEMIDLHGRTALITGGAGHIGNAMGEALAELGANVAILDINQSECELICRQLSSSFGIETMALGLNLAIESEIWSVPEAVLDHFGRLDILINCAALVGSSDLQGWAVPFLQQDSRAWKLALDVNLTAPFVLTQVCSEALSSSGHGSVINIGSIYGLVGPKWSLYSDTPLTNPAAYGASKGGLLQLTRYLATVLAPQVRVNMITPGGVFRNQIKVFVDRYNENVPLKRMATEEDFKGAVVYLASDLSVYVTGHNLIVDGGWTIW